MRRGCGEARHYPRPYPALAPKPPIMQPVYAGRPRNLRLRRSEKTPFCEGRGARKPRVSSTSVPRRPCSRPLSGGMGLGAGRFDTVPRLARDSIEHMKSLRTSRFDTVPRLSTQGCGIALSLGAGRSDPPPRPILLPSETNFSSARRPRTFVSEVRPSSFLQPSPPHAVYFYSLVSP